MYTIISVHIKPVWAGKASTFFQICMVLSILLAPELMKLTGLWWYCTRLLWWMTGFWALMVTVVYILRGIRYIEKFESDTENQF